MGSEGVGANPGGQGLRKPIDFPLVGAIVAAVLQIMAALLEWPESIRTIVYFIILAAVVFFVIALNGRKAGAAPYIILVSGMLVSLAIFVVPALGWPPPPPPPPAPGNYYVRVVTYIDTNANGVLDGSEKPLPDVRIRSRDFRGVESTYFTDAMGEANVILADFGQVSIGVCGVFQSHAVTEAHNSLETAFLVGVGIDPTRQRGCTNR